MDKITEQKLESIKNNICAYFSKCFGEDSSTFNMIKERMDNIQILIMDNADFKKQYEEVYGKSAFIPAGAYSKSSGAVILHQANLDLPRVMETVIHEIIHALSDNRKDKLGLYQYGQNSGKSFNEMATCYITAKIMGRGYGGSYSKDYRDVFKMFLETTDISDNELYELFFGSENWITENICNRFNKNNPDSLKELVDLYDRRPTEDFDKIKVLGIIKQSVETNNLMLSNSYKEFIENYCEYFDIPLDSINNKFLAELKNKVVEEPTYVQTDYKLLNQETINKNSPALN